jgi:hypothetical protein
MTDAERLAERRIRTCLVLSGGLLECAGAIRRVRWALDTDLTLELRGWLDEIEGDLFKRAMSADTEAHALRANPDAFYLAVPAPVVPGEEAERGT